MVTAIMVAMAIMAIMAIIAIGAAAVSQMTLFTTLYAEINNSGLTNLPTY